MNEDQAKFEGYAIVDVLGHQRYAGFVRTEAFGQAVLFRVDVPELPEREYPLDTPQYVPGSNGSGWCPKGTIVKREAAPGFTKYIGAGSIYTLSPCDEKAAFAAVEAVQRPEIKLISLPETHKSLSAPDDPDEDENEEDEDDDDDDEDDLIPV
jgi:hypothetical protein